MFCDITMPDGLFGDGRSAQRAQAALKRAADMGFTFYTHPEIEFFLLRSAMTSTRSRPPSTTAGWLRPHHDG